MAVIHKTTMTPGKLELLAAWLPARPWYAGAPDGPELGKAGGFRLDDPDGEVGIEFMVVTDTSGERPDAHHVPVAYHVPVTYRGAPLNGAEDALIGTAEHGVLGRRWVYDGTRDPVLLAQLLALLQGRAEPQRQSVSNTPDPSVTSHFTGDGHSTTVTLSSVQDNRDGTDVLLETQPHGRLTLQVKRVLSSDEPPKARGHVEAAWTTPDGTEHRGPFVVLHA
ncbi:1,4-alpha-glucan branching protein [Actinomadura spongiicola]|uniref:1,4-alpha-glucan branching protein n=1 Tax=Actinomadura spongiicola TaxID=2303421 RepID=A0A372GMN4_9ACTN|nr:1,4-alpha-glucan branching protein [Actinomadura spongiicola]RFS86313.1 1,4-alpha-glucan branching protein [Actinomadura spongiicola]